MVRSRSQEIRRLDSLPSTGWVKGEGMMDGEEVNKRPCKTSDWRDEQRKNGRHLRGLGGCKGLEVGGVESGGRESRGSVVVQAHCPVGDGRPVEIIEALSCMGGKIRRQMRGPWTKESERTGSLAADGSDLGEEGLRESKAARPVDPLKERRGRRVRIGLTNEQHAEAHRVRGVLVGVRSDKSALADDFEDRVDQGPVIRWRAEGGEWSGR